MPRYFVYFLDSANNVLDSLNFVAADDISAVELMGTQQGSHEIEIWDEGRVVARLAPDGSASLRPDPPLRS